MAFTLTPAEFRAKLAEALRSGRFTQGYGWLTVRRQHAGDLDCCLGVACKVYIENGGDDLKIKMESPNQDGIVSYRSSDENGKEDSLSLTELPPVVRKALGFHSSSGELNRLADRGRHSSLMGMNDDHVDFSTIADVIDGKREDGLAVLLARDLR